MDEPCLFLNDDGAHDETHECDACGRPVCGYCAVVNQTRRGQEWLCPECAVVP